MCFVGTSEDMKNNVLSSSGVGWHRGDYGRLIANHQRGLTDIPLGPTPQELFQQSLLEQTSRLQESLSDMASALTGRGGGRRDQNNQQNSEGRNTLPRAPEYLYALQRLTVVMIVFAVLGQVLWGDGFSFLS